MHSWLAGLVLAGASVASPALGEDVEDAEFISERLHAPLPLYTFEWQELWPRSMLPGPDVIAGCESRVRFGDWQFVPNPENEHDEPYWLRIANYGAFHCAANLYVADERSELDEGEFSRGLFVRIGKARSGSTDWELWALQQGFVPGSSYTLLAREVQDDNGIVEQFRVLQRHCPAGMLREARGMDVWLTRYCAVDSRTDLLALARQMIRKPALGTLTLTNE
jgi:hypothetical protein